MTPLFYLDIPAGSRVFDLGTGGGFPGIPLAIARPDVHFTLADSVRKKTMAVEDLVARLGLKNTYVRTGRVEEIARERGMAGSFDVVIARAVAPLSELIQWSRPFCSGRHPEQEKGRGRPTAASMLVALKGGDLVKEIADARTKGRGGAITVINMSFEGSLELGLEDKKLVLTHF